RVAKRFVNAIEHDEATARRASLARIDERRGDGVFRRDRQIGIVTHDERVLASQLEAYLREHGTTAHRRLYRLPRCYRSGETDESHASIRDQRRSDFGSEPLHDRIDTRW